MMGPDKIATLAEAGGHAMEPFKIADILTILIASVSMVVVAATLLVVFYLAYRVREDVTVMDAAERRIGEIERKMNESDHISDQITAVLYDLFGIVAGLSAVEVLKSDGIKVSEALNRKMEQDFAVMEKHFSEIGLFSLDKSRRVSAQRSLANMSGDYKTLDIMEKIQNKKIGIYDIEIADAVLQLRRRIYRGAEIDASAWTGRPSGGAF